MAHIGVANRTAEEQSLTYDGKSIVFAPKGQQGSIRIISDVPLGHIESRQHIKHKTREKTIDGEKVVEHLPQMHGIKIFDVVPVEEALKRGAAVEEDPKVVALRDQKKAEAEKKATLIAEIKEALLADGWLPPKDEPEPKKKGKGKEGD